MRPKISPKLAKVLTFSLVFLEILSNSKSTLASDLLLVGGGWEYPATGDPYGISMYDKVVELGGNGDPSQAVIRIFTTASSSKKSAMKNGELWVQDFVDLYAQKYPDLTPDVEWIPFHIGNCNNIKNKSNSNVINAILAANSIIFGGGDQSLITKCFFNENPATQTKTTTPVFDALASKFNNEDIIIAGTSAGTAVQTSSPMITEGESYEALLEKPIPLIDTPPFARELYYNPLGGLGFFPYGITDTHFSARGRQGRLIRLAAETDVKMAFGVDENTGLLITNLETSTPEMEVMGEEGVTVFDLSNAEIKDSTDYFSIENVSVTYLTQGDRFDPNTKTVLFPTKNPLICSSPEIPATSNDIFSHLSPSGNRKNPSEFVKVATSLFESCQNTTQGLSFENKPIFQVTMTQNQVLGSQAYLGIDAQGNSSTSYVNLQVDIQAFEPPQTVPESNLTFGLLGIGFLAITIKRQQQFSN